MRSKFWDRLSAAAFTVLWVYLGLVSTLDTAATVKFRGADKSAADAPLARLFTDASGSWDTPRVVGMKVFGTILVLGCLSVMYGCNRRAAFAVAGVLALCQSLVLTYLLVV